jgi:hypothetical protein
MWGSPDNLSVRLATIGLFPARHLPQPLRVLPHARRFHAVILSRKILQALSLILFTGAFTLPSFAQQPTDAAWRIDAAHSVSRISLGTAGSNSVVALALVRGEIHRDATASSATVSFEVTPGADSTAYPKFAFHSHDVRLTASGKLIASGELTLTFIDRPVTLDANEGYSGPVYSEPIVTSITRPVTFVFSAPAATLNSANGPQNVSATAVLATEDFPGVRELVLDTNWPIVAFDRNCEDPSDANEAYQASICIGTALTPRKSHEVPSTVSAEDNAPLDSISAPAGNKILIALDLRLERVQNRPERSADALERTAD